MSGPARGAVTTSVAVYSLAHFAVDFSCAFLMFSRVFGTDRWLMAMLIYNFCAFALQLPIGMLADRLGRNPYMAALGTILTGAAMALGGLPLAVIAGIGNALFHVGAGVDVMRMSGKKCAPLGVFVSPGAFGIYFGTILGKSGGLRDAPLVIGLAAFAIVMFAFGLTRFTSCEPPRDRAAGSRNTALLCLLLVAVVCIRSYAGFGFSFPWKSGAPFGVMAICAVACGKAAGGFLSDRFGARAASVYTLAAAAVLFLFAGHAAAGLAAIFLFNMTMPITLKGVADLFPGEDGFAFGLLTFGLFLGFLPVFFGWDTGLGAQVTSFLCAAASLPLMFFGLEKEKC